MATVVVVMTKVMATVKVKAMAMAVVEVMATASNFPLNYLIPSIPTWTLPFSDVALPTHDIRTRTCRNLSLASRRTLDLFLGP